MGLKLLLLFIQIQGYTDDIAILIRGMFESKVSVQVTLNIKKVQRRRVTYYSEEKHNYSTRQYI